MPKQSREVILEYDVYSNKYVVRRFENGQQVHVSKVDTKEIAEGLVTEWQSGGGPKLIVE